MNYKALGSSILFVGVLVIVQGAAAEDQASHLNAQYKQAKAKKDIEQAADYICQAAALDPKKYEKKCENARAAVSESLKEYVGNWGSGTSELQQKDYPGAIRDLRQIAFGPLHDKAQTLIAQARAQPNGAARRCLPRRKRMCEAKRLWTVVRFGGTERECEACVKIK
jgi:hypothetical protein